MKAFVTGGAGFVGSNIVKHLVTLGHEVTVVDNLSTGNIKNLEGIIEKIRFLQFDLLEMDKLEKAMMGTEIVFHIAANADIKENLKNPTLCLTQNTITTSNVLEAMRITDTRKIVFASTGSVYGEPEVFPTPENAPFPIQTSMYSASKLACEGLIQAYSIGYGIQSFIFRFVSLMGENYSHGCVYDFCKKLKDNPEKLEILGNGKQKKSYLYIQDCINAIFTVLAKGGDSGINIYNLGNEGYIDVVTIANIVCKEMGLSNVNYKFTGGERGWVGDSPMIDLDISRIKSLGWKPRLNIDECVTTTIRWILDNPWVYERDNIT